MGIPRAEGESRSDALAGVRRASACKRDDANQMARTIMSKDCNRGQSEGRRGAKLMKPVPHGEPYAGKLHVRFDEGAGVPYGGAPLYSTPHCIRKRWACQRLDYLNAFMA